MGRIRTIKPEFPQSESMGRVSRESRLCFILLFTLADDAGRLRGNSRMLASLLYPYDDDAKKHIDGWLTELYDNGCIVRYEVDDDQYIEICKWLIHQKIDKPSPSKIPAPNEDSRGFARIREDYVADQGKDQGKERIKDAPNGFDLFWKAYPKKKAKDDAQKAFAKRKPDQNLLDAMLKAIDAQIRSEDWMKDGGKFIPYPATWLNDGRWQDEVQANIVTVPSRSGIDPTLARLKQEEALVKPMPPEIRAKLFG